MSGRSTTSGGERAGSALSWAAAGIPMAAAALVVGVPLAGVLWRSMGGVPVDTDGATLPVSKLALALGRTLGATGVIALLAVVLAAPVGWALRSPTTARFAALLAVPMLMPNYFAYAGWSMLRAPRTVLGDRLADAPPWVSAWAGPVIGVVGLALWSWPLAALVLGSSARRIDQAVLDALELDGPSWWRRGLVIGRLMAPGVAGAFFLVMLVMAGSMVPLDVSRVETYGVLLMRWLNQHPSDLPVWRASWPLLVVAGTAAALLLRARSDAGGVGGDAPVQAPVRLRRVRPSFVGVWTGAVWALSVEVPGVLYVLNLREPPHHATLATIRRFLWAFWEHSGQAAAASAGVGARVGVGGALIGMGVWYAAARGRAWRAAAAVCAGTLLAAGLMPGVLVGTALRRSVDLVAPAIGDSTWMVVWAHLARFAFVGGVVGLWLARNESAPERDLRLIDAGPGVRGFAHACVARHWSAIAGAGLAAAILSFHEIEATVVVWPPGSRNLAQELLDALHFARDERLAAAAVNLMGVGVVLAYLAAWLAFRAFARRPTEG